MQRLPTLILLSCLIAAPALAKEAWLAPAYSLGAGLGATSIRGDYVRSTSDFAVGGGFDFHRENLFFLARGHTTVDNNGQAMDIALGLGNRWIKAGLGYFMTGGEYGTASGPVAVEGAPLAGLVQADSRRESSMRFSTIAPYIRLTPIHTRDTLINLDAWYGLTTRGEQKIPVRVLGLDGHLLSEPVSAGGMKGASIQISRRLTDNLAIFGALHWRSATQQGKSASIEGDVLGVYKRVGMPNMDFDHKAAMFGVQLVND